MSSLLEQAIVDAKALKEAALKNAESTIIDKYSEEVKSTLNQLLEQDELSALLGDAEAPAADADAVNEEEDAGDEIAEGVPDAFTEDTAELSDVNEGDSAEVTIDFKELAEALRELREGVEDEEVVEEAKGRLVKHPHSDKVEIRKDPEGHDEYTVKKKGASGTGYHTDDLDDAKATAKKMAGEKMDEEIEIDENNIVEMISDILSEKEATLADDAEAGEAAAMDADADQMDKAGLEESALDEEEELYEELSDDLLDAIMEKLTVDMGAELAGWAGRSAEDTKYQMEKELAHRRSTDMEEELEALKQAQEALVFENKKLKETLANYQEVIGSLKESVQDVNLSNARLLYTNRTLGNTSLNERQKQKIVEAISKAGSVEEAKTIHETLQSTVSASPKRGPQSLSEAINRPTSVIRASRKEEPKADPFTARMRKLAGIN
tara:strand:+ start:152 stop:1462 length:1311 start_codon:yes stop_codon:yes gene_type:complete